MRHLSLWAGLAFSLVILFSGCRKEESVEFLDTQAISSEMAEDWMDLILEFTQHHPGFTPPVAARAFGYTGLTLYETVRFGMPGYRSMAGQISELNPGMLPTPDPSQRYHWGIAGNASLRVIVKACYANLTPEQEAELNALESRYLELFSTNEEQTVIDRSIDFGIAMGTAITEYARTDGQERCFETNFPTDYNPPAGPGLWAPTPPAFQRALQPYWGSTRAFIEANVSLEQPVRPPPYSTNRNSPFGTELTEVYETVKNLSQEQLVIAEYWSDDPGRTATPPGHSISVLRQILQKEEADLALAAEAFAKLGMGVHDAFVSCWRTKYEVNYVRPLTVIHELLDPNFTIPLNTPPFPEFTSGHSVQSGAAAQILSNIFGINYAFTDRTHENRTDIDGSPRTFRSFYDMANEAAISRLYGGIHFRSAIDLGVSQGVRIGSNISNLKFK